MIGLAPMLVLGLAAARVTQLAVHDSILDPFRNVLASWHLRNSSGYWRDFWMTLVSCVYCTGWWASGAVLAAYLFSTGQWDTAPVLVHGVEWLAVAGIQMSINTHVDAA